MEKPQEQPARAPWWRIVLIGRNPKRTLVRLGILVVTCVLLRQYVVVPIRVEGISMLPTYKEKQLSVVNRLAYKLGEPQRGDVVALRLAGEKILYLKRIVGLPGESVGFLLGKLYINGERVDEPYVKLPSSWNMPPKEVPPGEYYFVGDNRSMPQPYHTEGRASRQKIVGKAML